MARLKIAASTLALHFLFSKSDAVSLTSFYLVPQISGSTNFQCNSTIASRIQTILGSCLATSCQKLASYIGISDSQCIATSSGEGDSVLLRAGIFENAGSGLSAVEACMSVTIESPQCLLVFQASISNLASVKYMSVLPQTQAPKPPPTQAPSRLSLTLAPVSQPIQAPLRLSRSQAPQSQPTQAPLQLPRTHVPQSQPTRAPLRLPRTQAPSVTFPPVVVLGLGPATNASSINITTTNTTGEANMTDSQKEVGAQFNENTAAKTNNFSDGGSKKRYYVEGALCGLAIATVILFCYIMITRRKRHTRTTRETVDLTENHTSESGSDNDFRILKHANLHNLNSLKPITPLKVEKTRDTHCVRLLRFIEQARNTPKTMTLVKAVENTTVPGNASHQPSCDNGLGHDSDVPERDELSSGSQSSIEYSENGGDAESSMYYESHGDDNSDFELDIVWDPDDDEVDAADLEQGESFEGSVRSSNGSAGSSLSSMSGSDFDNKGTSQKFMEPLHKSHFMPSAETASAPTVVLENQGHPCQEIRCAD